MKSEDEVRDMLRYTQAMEKISKHVGHEKRALADQACQMVLRWVLGEYEDPPEWESREDIFEAAEYIARQDEAESN